MRLARSDADSIEFSGRRPARSPLIIGWVLLFGPAVIPWVAPGAVDPARIGASLALGALAVGLIAYGWPGRQRVEIRIRERTLNPGRGPRTELAPEVTLRLVSAPPVGSATGPLSYGVALAQRDGPDVLLLADQDPARVLGGLARVRERLPCTVVSGWGLPAAASPWVDRAPAEGGDKGASRGEPRSIDMRRRVMTTLLVGSAVIACLFASEASNRLTAGDTMSRLSGAMPIVAVLVIAGIGIAIGTDETRFPQTNDLTVEHRVFGLTFSRRTVPGPSIRRAYFVSPDEGIEGHVLVETSNGLLAFEASEATARQLVSRFGHGGGPSISSVPPTQVRS